MRRVDMWSFATACLFEIKNFRQARSNGQAVRRKHLSCDDRNAAAAFQYQSPTHSSARRQILALTVMATVCRV